MCGGRRRSRYRLKYRNICVLISVLLLLCLFYRYIRPQKPSLSSMHSFSSDTSTISSSVRSKAVMERKGIATTTRREDALKASNTTDYRHEEEGKEEEEGCVSSKELPPNDAVLHIVPPPLGNVTLVCCSTTQGALAIAVHVSWAPRGAARFLDMVASNFFGSRVALFRSLKNFLVQFGTTLFLYPWTTFDAKLRRYSGRSQGPASLPP